MTERGKQTVVQVFASAGWGGGEQYVYDLAERLQREGYGVQLVSRESEVIRRKTASLGCPLVQFPLRSRFGLRSILKMKRLIESVEADIVHTHQFKDTFIALFARALPTGNRRLSLRATWSGRRRGIFSTPTCTGGRTGLSSSPNLPGVYSSPLRRR